METGDRAPPSREPAADVASILGLHGDNVGAFPRARAGERPAMPNCQLPASGRHLTGGSLGEGAGGGAERTPLAGVQAPCCHSSRGKRTLQGLHPRIP